MADFSFASTKRTSHWPAPMSGKRPCGSASPSRSRRSHSRAATPIRGSISRRARTLRSSPATTRTTILTIPLVTHKTKPEGAAAAIEAGVTLAPKRREPLGRQLGVPDRMLDVGMAQPRLDGPRVVASVGERISAAVAQHVGVDRERQSARAPMVFT